MKMARFSWLGMRVDLAPGMAIAMATTGLAACAGNGFDEGATAKAAVADSFVSALQACDEHTRLSDTLAFRFGETRAWVGLRQDGAVVEIFAAPDGSWTQILVVPHGLACITASGIGG